MKNIFIILGIVLSLVSRSQGGTIQFIDNKGVVCFASPVTIPKVVRKKKPVPAPVKAPPRPIQDIIADAQKKYGIESALIRAVIQTESGFNPLAVSDKGARGYMQIMPINYNAQGITDPHDPEQNIYGGTKYLRQMILRYDNRLDLALAAYNAGPEDVDKYGKIPPYEETQKYVNQVIKLYKIAKLQK